MTSAMAHARYRGLLYEHGHGYPFWIPEPNDASSQVYKDQGLSIGDVVALTDDGGYDYLFNIHHPATHPLNKGGTPSDFEPIPPPHYDDPKEVRRRDAFYPANTAITSSSVRKREISAEVAVEPAVLSSVVGGGVGFEFSTDCDHGAVLTLPRGGVRIDAQKASQYLKHAGKHAISWYRYANQDLAWNLRSGQLYLVTGVDKCSSWGVASFSKGSASHSASIKFLAAGVGSVDAKIKNTWSSDFGFEHRAGVQESGINNQCVFARGIVISVRSGVLAKLCRQNVKTNYLDIKKKPPPLIHKSHPFSSTSRQPYGEAPDGMEALDEGGGVELASFPGDQKGPSALLGDIILADCPDATIALVHDNDWISSTGNERGLIANDESFLEKLVDSIASSSTAVIDDNGVYTLNTTDYESPISSLESRQTERTRLF